MRTIIDIPDLQIKVLDEISNIKHVSRASIIREALNRYIIEINKNKRDFESAFGIWENENYSGVRYQRILREEWSI